MSWQHDKSKCFAALVVGIIIVMTMMRIIFGTLFFYNKTDSAPHGLYLRSFARPLEPCDYVIVRLPMDVPTLGVAKDFLLLKKVAGLPGDAYTVTRKALFFQGREYPLERSETLPQLMVGSYHVPDNRYLLLNEPLASFDSRYLGPIATEQIVCRVHLILRTDGW